MLWKRAPKQGVTVAEIQARLALEAAPTQPLPIVTNGTLNPTYTGPKWDVAHGESADWARQLPTGEAAAQ